MRRVKRPLHRKYSSETGGGSSLTSRILLSSPVLQRFVHSLTESHLKSVGDLPPEVLECSVSAFGEISQTDKIPAEEWQGPAQNDARCMPPEFMAMVGKLEGLFSQNEHTSKEDPRVSSPPRSAEKPHLIAESQPEASENLSTLSECIALQSGRVSGRNEMRFQLGDREDEPHLSNHAEKIEPPGATASTGSGPLSFEQILESLVILLAERVSAELKDPNKAFIQEARKEMAALMQDYLDSLAKITVDHCRREFDHLIDEFLAKSDRHDCLSAGTGAQSQVDRISDWMRNHWRPQIGNESTDRAE